MPQLGDSLPSRLDHFSSVFCHDGIGGQVFGPEGQAVERDASVGAAVEFGEGVGASKQIDYLLCILFTGRGEVGVIEAAASPA